MSFKKFLEESRADRNPDKDYRNAVLIEVPISEPFPMGTDSEHIYVWSKGPGEYLLEVHGNQKLHLRGKYYYRYDPPRTASTGSNQEPLGDWHLFDDGKEIAAWDSEGKARHGFPSGHKIPNKVYKDLQKKYPNAIGLKGRILESILEEQGGKSFLVEMESEAKQIIKLVSEIDE